MPPGEESLVHRAVSGDSDALAALLERHGPRIRRQIDRAIPQRWRACISAEDVMQETYIDAFLDIGGFDPADGEEGFARWLATLAKRNLVDALRMLEAEKRGGKHRRVEPRGADGSFVALYEQLGHSRSTPSGHAARNERHACLQRAIEQLPPAYRTVVGMCDLGGRPVEEVAAALERSHGAVFMLLARAHRYLHKYMGTASLYLSDTA